MGAGHGVGGGGRSRPPGRKGADRSGGHDRPDDPRQPRHGLLRLGVLLPARRRDLRPVRSVEHRPAGHPLGQLPQHGGHRVRARRRRGQTLLGLGDPAQLGEAGLCHQLPHRPGHTGEGRPGRHLEERQSVPVAGLDQCPRHRVVHRRNAETERRAARRHDPGDVVVEVRVPCGGGPTGCVPVRARGIRDVHTRRQQQLTPQQIRIGVRHLRGVRPVDHDVRAARSRDLPQGQVLPGEQGGQWHRWGRRHRRCRGGRCVRHGGRFLHNAPLEWMKRTLQCRFPAT